jgi:hypothetical protein
MDIKNLDIIIKIDDDIITLSGEEKDAFLQQKELDLIESQAFATQKETKAIARTALLQRLGITEAEAELLK